MSIHSTHSNAANSYQDYDSPDALLNDAALTREQKIKLLETWAVDALALARASAEGLSGGEQGQLKAVSQALTTLKSQTA